MIKSGYQVASNTFLDVISLPKAGQQSHPCRCGATKRGSAACLNQLHQRLRMYNCGHTLYHLHETQSQRPWNSWLQHFKLANKSRRWYDLGLLKQVNFRTMGGTAQNLNFKWRKNRHDPLEAFRSKPAFPLTLAAPSPASQSFSSSQVKMLRFGLGSFLPIACALQMWLPLRTVTWRRTMFFYDMSDM